MFRLTPQEKGKVVTDCYHLRKLKFSPVLPAAFTEPTNTKGVLLQRGQIEPFCYSFVTETAFGTDMRGEGILKPKKLGGTPGVIRTPDPLLRRQVLYPAELRARKWHNT